MSGMNLRMLPKTRDSWTYLYVERCRVDQEGKAISLHDMNGKTPVPCASLTLLLLGPGTTITHAAVKTLSDYGCSVLWTGEGEVRMYAQGLGETRSASRLLHQTRLYADPALRLKVVRKMYEYRFKDPLDSNLTLQQIRGKEGIRVRDSYAKTSRERCAPVSTRNSGRRSAGQRKLPTGLGQTPSTGVPRQLLQRAPHAQTSRVAATEPPAPSGTSARCVTPVETQLLGPAGDVDARA